MNAGGDLMVDAPINTGGDWKGLLKDLNTLGGGGDTMIFGDEPFAFGRKGLSPEMFDFPSSVSMDLILLAIFAYEPLLGPEPWLIVVIREVVWEEY